MTVLINGRPGDHIAVADRGLAYGDGLFETVAVMDGRCPLWDRHMRRLQAGCARLSLPFPGADLLAEEARRLIGNESRAVLKLILSRGQGGRGYLWPEDVSATRILMRHAWPDYPARHWQEGVAVRFCRTRLARQPALAGLKHLNRLEQVLARNEWRDPGIAEGLMRDEAGNVIEGTMSNVFMVKDGVLHTPDLSACGVAGIMRERIMELAHEEEVTVKVGTIDEKQLLAADEMFLSNSLIGLWPVRRLEQSPFAAGELGRRLQTLIVRDYPLV